jgi:Thioesterase-like superfamily
VSGDAGVSRSLFVRDGERYVPTPLTTGPWRADAMHGGAPSALIGFLVTTAAEEGEQVVRVQIDLEQPVPLEPLLAVVHRRQVSRRIAHLDIELRTGAGRMVSAKVLLMRSETASVTAQEESFPDGPDHFSSMDWSHLYSGSDPIFVRDAVDHRMVRGAYGASVPSAAWLSLGVAVVEGHAPCALSQFLAVADFGSPLSQSDALGPGIALINVDVNVTMSRQPVGPWFYLDAAGQVGPGGIGLAVSQVLDVKGRLGVITQSQIARNYSRQGAPESLSH